MKNRFEKIIFALVFCFSAFFLLSSCSDDNIEKEIIDDVSGWVGVCSFDDDTTSGNPVGSVYVSYELGTVVSASRLISDAAALGVKPGYKIKSLQYYGTLSSSKASYITLDDDENLQSTQVRLDADTFFVSDSEAISYTLVFNANGGRDEAPASQTLQYDEDFTLPNNTFSPPSGCAFFGWKINGTLYSAGTTISRLSTTDGATVTAYAYWLKDPITITFDGNGGTLSDGSSTYTKTISPGDTVDLAEIRDKFSRDGYWIGVWSYSASSENLFGTYSSSGYTYSTSTDNWANQDFTVYLTWYKKTYYISYYSYNPLRGTYGTFNYDSYMGNPVEVSLGTSVNLLNGDNIFTHTGYSFDHWEDGSGNAVSSPLSLTETLFQNGLLLSLYGVWNEQSMNITYDANGGTLSPSPLTQTVTYTSSDAVKATTIATRAGYICSGWNTSASGNGVSFASLESVTWSDYWNTSGLTLYAQWTPRIIYGTLPSGVSAKSNYDSDGNVTGITFTCLLNSLWICNGNETSGKTFTVNYSDYSSGTYTVIVFVGGSSTPSSFTFTIQ